MSRVRQMPRARDGRTDLRHRGEGLLAELLEKRFEIAQPLGSIASGASRSTCYARRRLGGQMDLFGAGPDISPDARSLGDPRRQPILDCERCAV